MFNNWLYKAINNGWYKNAKNKRIQGTFKWWNIYQLLYGLDSTHALIGWRAVCTFLFWTGCYGYWSSFHIFRNQTRTQSKQLCFLDILHRFWKKLLIFIARRKYKNIELYDEQLQSLFNKIPLSSKKPYNKIVIYLACSDCTGNYQTSVFYVLSRPWSDNFPYSPRAR